MDEHGGIEFDQFLIGSWSHGRFMELRERSVEGKGPGRLLSVAITDVVENALSAVYTFFDPEFPERGLGTLSLLRQIAWAQRDDRAHLYLGYWIRESPKMAYKSRFLPIEGFVGGVWRRLDPRDLGHA